MLEELAREVVVTEADQPGVAGAGHRSGSTIATASRQTHQPFTFDLLAQSRFTRAKGHGFRLQIQGINYMRAQKAVLGARIPTSRHSQYTTDRLRHISRRAV